LSGIFISGLIIIIEFMNVETGGQNDKITEWLKITGTDWRADDWIANRHRI